MSKPMSEIADEVLLQRARTGDRAAFVTFAARFWPRIGRFVWSMIGNASQASAITEEVVGEVLKSAEPPGVPAARLLYRRALRLALVQRRSNAAVAESAVFKALNRLSPVDRAAFLLRDVEQLSLREAAAILESTAAEVQGRVHRSRIVLTHLLGELAQSLDREARNRRTG